MLFRAQTLPGKEPAGHSEYVRQFERPCRRGICYNDDRYQNCAGYLYSPDPARSSDVCVRRFNIDLHELPAIALAAHRKRVGLQGSALPANISSSCHISSSITVEALFLPSNTKVP